MILPTKLPKSKGYTKAFTKTKLGYLLDKELAKGEFIWEYKYSPKLEDNAWHPSSHCVPSLHELYIYAKHAKIVAPPPKDGSAGIGKNFNFRAIEAPLAKIFQTGHFWHQYLQEVCLRAGWCEKHQIERNGKQGWGEMWSIYPSHTPRYLPYHWATGSADICPLDIPGHGEYLIDFKTMGSHQFRPNTPHELTMEKWECQLNVYMEFFDMEKAIILGINKDAPHDFKEFEFHRNQDLIDSLFAKWKLVAECLDEKVAPPEDEIWELPIKGAVNV